MSAPSDAFCEVIFIGLPGPTHHYGGLSTDNVASGLNRGHMSNPRLAALQALELVRLLKSLGVEAGVLPPQRRPHLPLLRRHFEGDDASVIAQAGRETRSLLEKASSSSAMWVANACTVTPIQDAGDGDLHLTAANLFTNLHRRIEADDTLATLRAAFAGVPSCKVHPPVSAAAGLLDEGAANHMRLSPGHGAKGLNVFVYGAGGGPNDPEGARQTLSASQAVAAMHRIPPRQLHFVKQNPDVIRQGVFHNDVIAVSNECVLLAHELAFRHGRDDIAGIARAYEALHDKKLALLVIGENQLTVEEAVHTYFFNSQIVSRPDGGMTVIAPTEMQMLYDGKAARLMDSLKDSDSPIDDVRYVDLRQSMRNGGGPACLRLRMVLSQPQLTALRQQTRLLADDVLLASLERMIRKHYPDELTSAELASPDLAARSQAAVEEAGRLMRLAQP